MKLSLAANEGAVWELNAAGKMLLRLLKLFPAQWYCSAYYYVVEARK